MGDHTNVDYSLLGDDHVKAYLESDGEVGYEWNSVPTLLLTTTGRTSGKPRTVPLIFARDGADYLVVASQGGMPVHPNWYRNLEVDPSATIQVKADVRSVTARTATAEEKPRLWKAVNDVWPRYDLYQSYTDRSIPVVILTPSS